MEYVHIMSACTMAHITSSERDDWNGRVDIVTWFKLARFSSVKAMVVLLIAASGFIYACVRKFQQKYAVCSWLPGRPSRGSAFGNFSRVYSTQAQVTTLTRIDAHARCISRAE